MIFIGTDEGIYRWLEGAGWPVFHGLQDRSVVGLASPGPGVLVAVDRSGGVWETTDNGLSWCAVPLPEGAGPASVAAVAGLPPTVVVAVEPLGLYQRAVGAPIPRSMEPPPAHAGFVPRVAHRARGLAEGATALLAPRRRRVAPDAEAVRLAGWTRLKAPTAPRSTTGPVVRALVEAQGVWFAAVGGAGLWTSGDGGSSWTQCHGLPSEVYAIRPVAGRPGHVWAATDDGCRFSTDSGATWADRSAGLENVRHVRAVDVKPGAPDTLLAGAAPRGQAGGESNFALYESADGGEKWTQVKKVFPDRLEADAITDIRYDPADPDNAVVALRSGELWATRNDGVYWGPLARQIKAARVLCATA